MQFKKCTTEDLAPLQQISEKIFRITYEQYNTPQDMEAYIARHFAPDTLRAQLRSPASSFFFVLSGDGAPAGYIKLNHAPEQTDLQDDASIELERIYVLPECQGKQYGKALLQKAVDYAAQHKKSYVWLGVWEKNKKAITFYEKNGFHRFGEHPFILGKDQQTDYLMRKDI